MTTPDPTHISTAWGHCWTCDSDILPGQMITLIAGRDVHWPCRWRAWQQHLTHTGSAT